MMLGADSPKQSKYFSHLIDKRKRQDWKDVKLRIMEDLVRQKFCKNQELQKKLLDTKGAFLEETNTWNDKFWGVCNGVGENHLGKILMRTRSALYKQERG